MRGASEAAARLETLFTEHADRLAGALAAAGYPDATDAVQEAFVQAVVHWRKVDKYDDPLQWVRRVAINKARNRARGYRRRNALVERIGAQPAPAAPVEPRADLTEAITALPEQQRLACSLFYFADLSVADVAIAMEISEGTVKYHLHAARTALAATLEACDDS